MTPLMLRRLVRKDDLFVRFQTLSSNVKDRNDLTRLRKELLDSHATRSSRSLLTRKGGTTAESLLEANLDDIAKRSRAVEIIVHVSKDANLLRSAMDAVIGHILSEYNESLRPIRTKADREALVNSLMVSEQQVLHGLDQLIEAAQWLVEDLDKTSWALSNAVKILSLIMQRENIVKSVAI
jgi:hypothetical protein